MNQTQATHVVAYLNAGFPRDTLEPESFAIWVGEVMDLPSGEAGLDAAKVCVRGGDRFPTIREFRTAYRQAFDRMIAGRELEAPIVVAPPPQDFIALWDRVKREGIGRDFDSAVQHTSTADLPETDRMPPRPLWARHLRRARIQDGTLRLGIPVRGPATMLPPTDEEKHDAICVLQAGWDGGGDWPLVADALLTEAQRIMDEASAA